MFRFTIDNTVAVDVNDAQLATHNIGRDDSFAERLRMDDNYNDDETAFRAENENPSSVIEAVSFVQGIFFRPPTRVWVDDEEHEVTAEHVAAADKPTA